MAAPGPPRPGSFLRGCVEPEPAVSGAAAAAGPSSRRRWGLRRGRREGGREARPGAPREGRAGGGESRKAPSPQPASLFVGPCRGEAERRVTGAPPPPSLFGAFFPRLCFPGAASVLGGFVLPPLGWISRVRSIVGGTGRAEHGWRTNADETTGLPSRLPKRYQRLALGIINV